MLIHRYGSTLADLRIGLRTLSVRCTVGDGGSIAPWMARERGMALTLPPVQPRSRKAFEAVAFAAAQGRFAAMHEALFRGFFERGRDIGKVEVLCAIGAEAGLDAGALRAALDDGRHLAAVLDDQELAHALGLTGVPIMFLRKMGKEWKEAIPLSGAVPYDMMKSAAARLL